MTEQTIIARARRVSGLSQAELAHRAGTSQSTLSGYELGTKSPTLAVAERILEATGHQLDLIPSITFRTYEGQYGVRPFVVPDRLWSLYPPDAVATVDLPHHLFQRRRQRSYELRNRSDRARAYELLLRYGKPEDIVEFIDGSLLIDVWDKLDLPDPIRRAWSTLIQ